MYIDGMTGKELQRLREAAGLNQTELAAMIGVTSTSIANWESSDQIRKPVVIAIRAVFDKQGKARRTA